ncbi:MAG: hypothetical protein P8Y71_23270 [Pseudolabrys sp.]|jgi:hypothetical protein
MSTGKKDCDGRARSAAWTAAGDLYTALLETYWIIDAAPCDPSVLAQLKTSITNAILSGEVGRMEQAFGEAQIAISSEIASASIY